MIWLIFLGILVLFLALLSIMFLWAFFTDIISCNDSEFGCPAISACCATAICAMWFVHIPVSSGMTIYEKPVSIIKTNNYTLVTYVDNSEYSLYVSDKTSFFNATNIMIKKIQQLNFRKKELDSKYEIEIKE